MSILVFEHCAAENTAVLGAVLQAHGRLLRVVKPYIGEPVPENLDGVDGVVSMGGPKRGPSGSAPLDGSGDAVVEAGS